MVDEKVSYKVQLILKVAKKGFQIDHRAAKELRKLDTKIKRKFNALFILLSRKG